MYWAQVSILFIFGYRKNEYMKTNTFSKLNIIV